MKNILVIGSINIDLVMQTSRIPGQGESFVGDEYSWIPGGKGANQGVAAARAGGDVTFLGKIGNDENGNVLRRGLADSGIDTSGILTADSAPTGMAAIIVESSGENRILVFPGANLELQARDVTDIINAGPSESSRFDALLLSLEIPVPVIEGAVDAARNAKIPLYVDAGPSRPINPDIFKDIRMLSPNQSELAALTGKSCSTFAQTRQAAAALFRRLKPEYLIVKMGAAGCLLLSGGRSAGVNGAGDEVGGPEQRHVPAFPVKAVDGTAAGDAFTAGLTVEHLKSGDMAEAVRFGSAAGALAASKLGAQPSLPTRSEVEDFLKQQQG